MAGTRNYQSIGEVLVAVKTEFPDITISKIRFLESEGLITPARTPS
jgi:DNA-binding transcriptional MerR regulator